jgi:hypothetical protein
VGNIGVHHGVVLLTITHVWTYVTEFIESMEAMGAEKEEIKKQKNIATFSLR